MKQTKPDKPYVGYPLFAHNAGVWARKINGKFHYFGPWDDPQGALDRYIAERDFLYAGRTPPSRQNTVNALLAAFLANVVPSLCRFDNTPRRSPGSWYGTRVKISTFTYFGLPHLSAQ